jgi:hypothetical protein
VLIITLCLHSSAFKLLAKVSAMVAVQELDLPFRVLTVQPSWPVESLLNTGPVAFTV